MTHAHIPAASPPLGNARPISGAHSLRVTPNDATPKVMSLTRVTLVTRNSKHLLRVRARRASLESYVTHVISMLTSDTVTSLQNYRLHRAYAPAVGLSKIHVTSVTRLKRHPK